MVFARSAAMAFNRLVDRGIDADNPRTARRHIPAGLLSVWAVTRFTILSSLAFVAATLIFLPNTLPVILSVPVLLVLLGYSYAKRFTAWCHYWLSAALMLSPLAAWIAIRGTVEWPPVLIAAVVFFWVGGFDILYSCQDAEFDQERQLFSIPSRWGVPPHSAGRAQPCPHRRRTARIVGGRGARSGVSDGGDRRGRAAPL